MMRRSIANLTRVLKFGLVSALMITFLSACVTAEDEALFNSSLVMAQQGQKESAFKNLQRLCAKFPEDKRFCLEANALKKELYTDNMSFVKSKLDSKPPVSLSTLNAVEGKLGNAGKYAENRVEIERYKAKLSDYRTLTKNTIDTGLNDADQYYQSGKYFKAFDSVSKVKPLNPAKVGPILDSYSMKIVDAVIPQVEKLIAEDNWKEAKELLIPLSRIKADDSRITKYLEKAEESDQADYYIGKAEALRAEGDLEQALEFYRKALAFPEVRQQVQQAMDETRIQLVEISFLKGVEYADQELNKQAYDNFMEAFNTMKKLPLELRAMVSVPKAELESYYDNMYFLGQKAADEGAYGQSYLYFKLLYDLVPSYHGLLATKKGVEDKILSRALKSIAVIPFKSPVNEPELGLQVTSTIMQILQRQLSDDIKIIERGALEILLREYELAVAGNLSEEESNPDAFRIKSADFLLMGEVLDSRTETNVQNSKRKVRVKVSQDKVRNIEWEDWYKEAVRLREKNKPVPPEPQKYIFKPVYDYAEYDVAFHEKVSYLSISYRVVETSQGRITFSNTVQSQKESKDEATSGIDLGTFKVPMKAANLPTDIELSNEVRKDAIDRISGEIKNIFKDQDKKYLEQAKKLESSNNLQEAVELYANSILLMKRKGKDVSGVEDKVGKYLDILSAY